MPGHFSFSLAIGLPDKKAPWSQYASTTRARQHCIRYSPTGPSLSLLLTAHQLQEYYQLVITREELGSLTKRYVSSLRSKETINDLI